MSVGRWVVLGMICASTVSAFAQGVGTWRNYTSMKNVTALARAGSDYWASTSGGLFRWSPGNNSFLRLTSADGLQSIALTSVAVDSDGYVWSGSTTGYLHVYQPSTGSIRVVSDLANTNQVNKQIDELIVSGDTVLVCTEFGLSIFRRSKFEFGDSFTRFGSIPTGTRIAVVSAAIANGRVWAGITDEGTQNPLNRIASAPLDGSNLLVPDAWTLETLGSGSGYPTALVAFNGTVYAGMTDGLYVRTPAGWNVVPAFSGQSIVALTVSGSHLIVATTGTQLFAVATDSSSAPFGPVLAYPPTSIGSAQGSSPNPVVGTNGGGMYTYVNNLWSAHLPNGPNSNEFTSVGVDAHGVVWGATGPNHGTGINRFDGTTWTALTKSNSVLPEDQYYKISIGCNGSVWASSWGWGYVEIPNGSTTVDSSHIYNTNVGMVGISNNTDFIVGSNVVCDGNGNTWAAVLSALDKNILAVRTPDGKWHHLPIYYGGVKITNLVLYAVDRVLAVDGYDNLWAVSRDPANMGVLCMQNGGALDSVSNLLLRSSNGLPSDNVTSVVVDMDNTVWIGTDRGIAIVLDPSSPANSIAAYKPLLGESINTIAIDPLNQKWVGTPEGVVVLSPDGTQVITSYTVETTQGKLIDNNVQSIAVDPKTGAVYFASLSGLASLYTTAAAPVETDQGFKVYPNPFRLPATTSLTIDGLLANSKIKILTINGRLVRDLTTDGGRIGSWDGRDNGGSLVSSGVYFIIGYTDDGNTVKGKVAVLRR